MPRATSSSAAQPSHVSGSPTSATWMLPCRIQSRLLGTASEPITSTGLSKFAALIAGHDVDRLRVVGRQHEVDVRAATQQRLRQLSEFHAEIADLSILDSDLAIGATRREFLLHAFDARDFAGKLVVAEDQDMRLSAGLDDCVVGLKLPGMVEGDADMRKRAGHQRRGLVGGHGVDHRNVRFRARPPVGPFMSSGEAPTVTMPSACWATACAMPRFHSETSPLPSKSGRLDAGDLCGRLDAMGDRRDERHGHSRGDDPDVLALQLRDVEGFAGRNELSVSASPFRPRPWPPRARRRGRAASRRRARQQTRTRWPSTANGHPTPAHREIDLFSFPSSSSLVMSFLSRAGSPPAFGSSGLIARHEARERDCNQQAPRR